MKDHYVVPSFNITHNGGFGHTITVKDGLVSIDYREVDTPEDEVKSITILPEMVEDVILALRAVAKSID
jgi:hypothetical protein